MTMTGSCGGPPEFRNVNTFDYMYGTLYAVALHCAGQGSSAGSTLAYGFRLTWPS